MKSLEKKKKFDQEERVRVSEPSKEKEFDSKNGEVKTKTHLQQRRKNEDRETYAELLKRTKFGIHGRALPQFYPSKK